MTVYQINSQRELLRLNFSNDLPQSHAYNPFHSLVRNRTIRHMNIYCYFPRNKLTSFIITVCICGCPKIWACWEWKCRPFEIRDQQVLRVSNCAHNLSQSTTLVLPETRKQSLIHPNGQTTHKHTHENTLHALYVCGVHKSSFLSVGDECLMFNSSEAESGVPVKMR